MVCKADHMYPSHILPSLYKVSPSLQALAVTTGYVNPNSISDRNLLRAVPFVTTAGLEVTVMEEFEEFRRELGVPESCIAIIDASGRCVWSTATAFAAVQDDYGDITGLHKALIRVLGSNNDGDLPMDMG